MVAWVAMVATNRWQILVLVTSLAMVGIAVFSKSWVFGEDHLRVGLFTHTWSGTESWVATPRQAFRVMGYLTAFVTAATAIAAVLLIAYAWIQSRFPNLRWLVMSGVILQIAISMVFVNGDVAEITTWTGPAFSIFLVGSMGMLIAAAALQPQPVAT